MEPPEAGPGELDRLAAECRREVVPSADSSI